MSLYLKRAFHMRCSSKPSQTGVVASEQVKSSLDEDNYQIWLRLVSTDITAAII
jgi:hypothetical protein